MCVSMLRKAAILVLIFLLPACQEAYPLFDQDNDGVSADKDCDDHDAAVGSLYPDTDGDGFGDDEGGLRCDQPAEGSSDSPGDCNDSDASIYPGAEEVCDGVDNNCLNSTDDEETVTVYPDSDGDGHGKEGSEPIEVCTLQSEQAQSNDDCDDGDPAIYAGADEVCDGVDNNCSSEADEGLLSTYFLDQDGDGFGSSTETKSCVKPEGYVESTGDCDDTDPATYPGADELCDEVDNDCDEAIDEDVQVRNYYYDGDGDGWGQTDSVLETCDPPEGYVLKKGDCDDSEADAHPNGTEVQCTGVDEDCSSDTPDVSDSDEDGYDTCDPGTWGADDKPADCADLDSAVNPGSDEQSCTGKDEDCSEATPDSTDADQDGFDTCAAEGSAGNGLDADCNDNDASTYPGAEERCDGVDRDCDGSVESSVLTSFWYDEDGDGFGAEPANPCSPGSNPVQVRGDCNDSNSTIYPGAAESVDGVDADCGGSDDTDPHVGLNNASYPDIQSALDAAADEGSIIWVGPTLAAGALSAVELDFDGKKVKLISTEGPENTVLSANGVSKLMRFNGEGADTIVDGFTLISGIDDKNTGGGCVYMKGASPTFLNVRMTACSSPAGGGAVYMEDSSPTFTYCAFVGNRGAEGGALYLVNAHPTLENCTLTTNKASGFGGGIFLSDGASELSVHNSILVDNPGYNIYLSDLSSAIDISTSTLYNRMGNNHNLTTLPESVLETQADFVRLSNSDPSFVDIHLLPDSVLRDAGTSGSNDPDGSPLELGVFGGESFGWYSYVDQDEDKMYDAWEETFGLDPEVDDSGEDLDLDGASNLEEFLGHSNPAVIDTDGDLIVDGDEFDAGSDPLDVYSRPGTEGPVTLSVPVDFSNLQAALDAIEWEGAIQLTTPQSGNHVAIGKTITLSSALSAQQVYASEDSALELSWCALELSELNLSGSETESAGAAGHLFGCTGSLSSITFKNNSSTEPGGGLYLEQCSMQLSDVTFSDNDSWAEGGAIYAVGSDLELLGSTFLDNDASNGAAIYLDGSSLTVSGSEFQSNLAEEYGGAIAHQGSTLSLVDSSFSGNAGPEGAAIFGSSSTLSLNGCTFDENMWGDTQGGAVSVTASTLAADECTFTGNVSELEGGAIRATSGSALSVSSSSFDSNQAYAGGAVYLDASSATLDFCTFSGNVATEAGGGAVSAVAGGDLTLLSTDFSGNSAPGGGAIYLEESAAEVDSCHMSSNDSAVQGGGAILSSYSELAVNNSAFSANSAYLAGGAIRSESGDAAVFGSFIFANSADYVGGGGIAVFDGASLQVEYSAIYKNSSRYGGGGLRVVDSDLILQHSVVVENTKEATTVNGGGLFASSDKGNELNIKDSIFSNNDDYDLFIDRTDSKVDVDMTYSAFYQSVSDNPTTNVDNLDSTVLFANPSFLDDGTLTVTNTVVADSGFPRDDGSSLSSNTPIADSAFFGRRGSSLSSNTPIADSAFFGRPGSSISSSTPIADSAFLGRRGSSISSNTPIANSAFFGRRGSSISAQISAHPPTFHLSTNSGVKDKGNLNDADLDGSRSDMGIYGGPEAGQIDLDRDGYPAYPWPGSCADAPANLDVGLYDCDDFDGEKK